MSRLGVSGVRHSGALGVCHSGVSDTRRGCAGCAARVCRVEVRGCAGSKCGVGPAQTRWDTRTPRATPRPNMPPRTPPPWTLRSVLRTPL
eukprot:170250-Prorocentrum_minimum.AAC.1